VEEVVGWVMESYRTLVLKYDLPRLPAEAVEKISMFLKVQEEFRRWAEGWLRGEAGRPGQSPLKYFARTFIYAGKTLDWLYGVAKNGARPKRLRPPLIFDVQLRLNNERDVSRGVFVDLRKRELRIRKWGGSAIALPLGDEAARWILARVNEGGRLVLAAAWVGTSRRNRATRLYVALVFRREVAPMQPKRLLVVDLNALHNGLAWAVVEGERIVTRGVLRPDVSKITHMQKVASKLDSVCAEKDEACGGATAANSRIWRLLRSWEEEAVKKLVRLALQYRAIIVVDMPKDSSIRTLKESRHYSPRRKALLNFGRLRRRLAGLAGWHGIEYREERLYSTMCPSCGEKMQELPNRRVRCQCGFEAHRDEVPAMWAMRRFSELTSFSNPPFLPSAGLRRCMHNI
jgi:putative transposase